MDEVVMVEVDGIRYRPEDAPQVKVAPPSKNKARQSATKTPAENTANK